MDEQPTRVTDPALTAVRDELAAREPIFHHPELGTSPADLDRQAAAEFEEVGASGRRYSREFVLATVHDRFVRGIPDDPWELSGFHCVALRAPDVPAHLRPAAGRPADPPGDRSGAVLRTTGRSVHQPRARLVG